MTTRYEGRQAIGDHVTLAVTVWGRASTEPLLVLVHGWTGGRHDWDDVGAELAEAAPGRRVLAYDHRGHGTSTHTGDPATYTFERLVEDLDALLAKVAPADEVPQIDLLGHSMGGVVAQWWALRHPERLRSLVLMDTAGAASGGLPMVVLERSAQLGREQGMAAVVDEAVAAFGADLAPDDADALRATLGRSLGAMDPEAFLALARELGTHPSVLDALGGLDVPTTVIVGEHDDGLRGAADELAAAIPAAHLVVIPDAGHSPQREQRDAWLAALREHLDRFASSSPQDAP
jgi:pimeloyl-ACP methyl ester carboxylesterase